jgi:hypothetical protein
MLHIKNLKELDKLPPELPFPTHFLVERPKSEALPDRVNNPAHYGKGSIECIDYIEDFLSEEEFIGYLRGNIAKYLHRWRYKNQEEDLLKSQWYLNRLINTQGKGSS